MCGTHTVEDFKDSGAVHLRYIFDPDRDSASGGVIFTPIPIIFRGMTCSPFPMQRLQYPSLVYLGLGFLQRFGLIKRRFYNVVNAIDAGIVQQALHDLEDCYRAPVTLFYMQQHSYREIAEILEIPIGTVMSRISRGKAEMKAKLTDLAATDARKVISMPKERRQ